MILGLGGLDRLGCSGVFLGAVSWLRRYGEGGLRELSSQGLRAGHFVANRWGFSRVRFLAGGCGGGF